MINKKSALGCLLSLCVASPSFAIGGAAIGNEVPSARAGGEGYVGIAGENNDPITAYINPAALTTLPGTQATLGATWENLHGEYESDAGQTSKMRSIDAVAPNFAVSQNFLDGKLAAGLAVLSPYGLETHWPGDGPLRYLATNSTLKIITVTPAIGYQVCPMMSVGAGADYFNVFDASLEKEIPQGPGSDANSRISGTGADWGYHLGVTVKPNEHHSIGLVYHSRVKLNVNGSFDIAPGPLATGLGAPGSDFTTSAYTDIYLPQNIQLGYAFKPNDRLTLEADAAWTDWYSARDLNVRLPSLTPLQAFVFRQIPTDEPLNWRDAWSMATGANYKVTSSFQTRAGFFYEPHASPESTFSPSFLDLSRYGLSTGIGYDLTSFWTVDLAYTALFFHSREVNNALLQEAGISSGTFSNFVNLVALNFTYRFGNLK